MVGEYTHAFFDNICCAQRLAKHSEARIEGLRFARCMAAQKEAKVAAFCAAIEALEREASAAAVALSLVP